MLQHTLLTLEYTVSPVPREEQSDADFTITVTNPDLAAVRDALDRLDGRMYPSFVVKGLGADGLNTTLFVAGDAYERAASVTLDMANGLQPTYWELFNFERAFSFANPYARSFGNGYNTIEIDDLELTQSAKFIEEVIMYYVTHGRWSPQISCRTTEKPDESIDSTLFSD